jgi:hypothetical protein
VQGSDAQLLLMLHTDRYAHTSAHAVKTTGLMGRAVNTHLLRSTVCTTCSKGINTSMDHIVHMGACLYRLCVHLVLRCCACPLLRRGCACAPQGTLGRGGGREQLQTSTSCW